MRHSPCRRIVLLLCLGVVVIILWGCAAHPPPPGHTGRRTLAELLQWHDPDPPTASPETPTDEDRQLSAAIKARWPEVEQMLADRQTLLSAPRGTRGTTQEKTYVFDVRQIALIERYAQEHRLDRNDVLYQALEEFFQRRGYAAESPR